MKKLLITLVLMVCLIVCVNVVMADEFYNVYKAYCTRVVDGDTIDLEISVGFGLTLKERARFLDFDAPETWRPKTELERQRGQAATEFLKNLIENKYIVIAVPEKKYRGSFGRILITPFYNNESIVDLMILNGHEK